MQPGAVELLDRPAEGRVFTHHVRVRLGDVDAAGLLRLDATARLLQDVATDDANDAGLDRRFGWLVRRTMIAVTEPAKLGEELNVSTWCTALGRAWAERRTQLRGQRGGRIEAVSLWVQVEAETGRPARLASDFTDAYRGTAGDRTVSSRLSIPASDDEPVGTWTIRVVDIDPWGHVNNAATWAFVEEVADLGDRRGTAEIEHHEPLQTGDDLSIRVDASAGIARLWRNGLVCTSARWSSR